MSVSAECPECSTSEKVPDDMVGRKVRCTHCEAVFVVEKASKRSGSRSSLSGSGGMRRNQQPQSNTGLRVTLALGVLILVVAGGVGLWFAFEQEMPKEKITITKTTTPPPKSPQAKGTPKGKAPTPKELDEDFAAAEKAKDAAKDLGGKTKPGDVKQVKTPDPVLPKKEKVPPTPPPLPKPVQPTVVAKLTASSLLSITDVSTIKAILPMAKAPDKIGLHVFDGNVSFFEMYDLKKSERVARVNLGKDVALVDVDPEGVTLVTALNAKEKNRIFVYSLPDGKPIDDNWNAYDNIRDLPRFLDSGSIAQISLLSKNDVLVMTSRGFGDVWEVKTHVLRFPIPKAERKDFRNADEAHGGRDFVLSPDRAHFAFATDEGIQLYDVKTGNKAGVTPKLTAQGAKPEIAGMGFDPTGTKLGVYYSTGKTGARQFYHARFLVPSGELAFADAIPDPGDFGAVEFVDGEAFLAVRGKEALLRDGKGKVLASGRISSGLFAPKLVKSNLAYVFLDAQKTPTLGVTTVPIPGAEIEPVVVAPMPPPMVKKDGSLDDLFATTPTTPKAAPKARTNEQEEIWEFGAQGILRRGYKAAEK